MYLGLARFPPSQAGRDLKSSSLLHQAHAISNFLRSFGCSSGVSLYQNLSKGLSVSFASCLRHVFSFTEEKINSVPEVSRFATEILCGQ